MLSWKGRIIHSNSGLKAHEGARFFGAAKAEFTDWELGRLKGPGAETPKSSTNFGRFSDPIFS
jgi:hypothetical protein